MTVLSDETSCNSNEKCGGCDECLMAQAGFYGCGIHELKGFWAAYECVYFQARELCYWLKFRWWSIRKLFRKPSKSAAQKRLEELGLL